MQKVAIGDAAGTEDMGFRYIRGVTLWAKRGVDDEDVKLNSGEREGSAGLRRERIETQVKQMIIFLFLHN